MDEVIKTITEAEREATEIKEAAQAKAAQILSDAGRAAEETAKKCEEECRLWRESSKAKAEKDAAEQYEKTVAEKEAAAKKYADGVLKTVDGAVNDIVRRITRGDC